MQEVPAVDKGENSSSSSSSSSNNNNNSSNRDSSLLAASPSNTENDLLIASHNKLQETADSLRHALHNDLPMLRLQPCASVVEAQGYRCRCSFQIVRSNNGNRLAYAVRENGQPAIVERFDVANERIQQAMQQLLTCLNNDNDDDTTTRAAAVLVPHLTSVTFVTSWNPALDCLVTLHYSAPLSTRAWTSAARQLAAQHGWRQVTGRSKGRVLRALPCHNDDDEAELVVHDTVYLQQQQQKGGRNEGEWTVALDKETLLSSGPIIDVVYVKPESAFAHPNAHVMCQALAWMLNRISAIGNEHANMDKDKLPTLMELYCGCGAHTMALVRSGLLSRVVAVELDERLVQACRRNAQLNHVATDEMEIVSQDAGAWSAASSSATRQATILLVDPPRQGLDARICQMAATNTNLQHVLYISCGRDALVRDLRIMNDTFEMVDCVLFDLFPQTYSVESLVHLKRRC